MRRRFHPGLILTLSLTFAMTFTFSQLAQAQSDDADLDIIETEIKKSEDKPINPEKEAREAAPTKVETLSDLSRLAPFSEVSVLQRRYMPKTGRFQFFGGIAGRANDPWYYGYGANGRVSYGFSEAWSAEFTAVFMGSAAKQAVNDLIEQHSVRPESIITMGSYYGGSLMWTPIYGKISLFNQRIIPFDMYFTAGGGQAQITGGSSTSVPAFEVGTGQIFALNRSMAARWDLSFHFFSATQTDGTSGTYNSLLLTFGVSYYIPEAKYR